MAISDFIKENPTDDDLKSLMKYIIGLDGDSAEINSNVNGLTPLLYSIKHKQFKLAKLILNKGADINLPNAYDLTPLMYAVHYDTQDILSMLIARGAAIDKQDDIKYSALHYAAFTGNLAITNLLIANKANLNILDRDNNTPLHVALARNNTLIADSLIKAGANVNAKNDSKLTPMQYATKKHKTTIDNAWSFALPSLKQAGISAHNLTRRIGVAYLFSNALNMASPFVGGAFNNTIARYSLSYLASSGMNYMLEKKNFKFKKMFLRPLNLLFRGATGNKANTAIINKHLSKIEADTKAPLKPEIKKVALSGLKASNFVDFIAGNRSLRTYNFKYINNLTHIKLTPI